MKKTVVALLLGTVMSVWCFGAVVIPLANPGSNPPVVNSYPHPDDEWD